MVAEVEQADKALASAKATIAVTQAMVLETQSDYERWESESKRMAGLAKTGVVDAQARDETRNRFGVAEGRLASARAAVQKAEADRDRAESDMRARQRCEWRWPGPTHSTRKPCGIMRRSAAAYDGIVALRRANTGDLVRPAGGQGDWLFRVARIDPIRVVVAVPEADAGTDNRKVRGQKLTVPALPGRDLSGKVTRTSWALEPGARTLRTEIELPNKKGLLRSWYVCLCPDQLPVAGKLDLADLCGGQGGRVDGVFPDRGRQGRAHQPANWAKRRSSPSRF